VPKQVTLHPGEPSKDGKLLATHVTTSSLVKYKETTEMEVRLNPLRKGDYECQVLFSGNDDIRVYRFLMRVNDPRTVVEPVAPLQREIMLTAGTEQVETFEVTNNGPEPTEFKVLVDLPKGVAGTIGGTTPVIKPGETIEYDVLFCPPREGEVHGTLAFVAEKEHLEYQLRLDIAEAGADSLPNFSGEVELKSSVAEAVQMSVTVDNPLPVGVTYSCTITGGNDGELISEPTFVVAAESTAEYAVTFQPDVIGRGNAELVLKGSAGKTVIGSYLYKLNTNATPAASPEIFGVHVLAAAMVQDKDALKISYFELAGADGAASRDELSGYLAEFCNAAELGDIPDEYSDAFLTALFSNDVNGDHAMSWGEFFNQVKTLSVAAPAAE
jgi:hypothetical protein